MTLPYKVLGTYKPNRWRASLIGRDLTDLTAKLGYTPHQDKFHGPLKLTGRNWCSEFLHAEVRHRSFKTKMAEDWHFDGDTTPNSRPECALVLWASNTPTLVRWRDGADTQVYQAKPYEVIVFHNLHCLHRRPENAPRIRWIFRQRVQVPTHTTLP